MSWNDPLTDDSQPAYHDSFDDSDEFAESGQPKRHTGCGTLVGIGLVAFLAFLGGSFMTGLAVFRLPGPFQDPSDEMAILGAGISLLGGLVFGALVGHFLYRWESRKRPADKTAEQIFEHFEKQTR